MSRELIEVSEQICRLRPVEQTLSEQEKNGRNDPAAWAMIRLRGR
jgi:hypothetical protein